MTALFCNLLTFQATWWCAVLCAARGQGWIGLLVGFGALALHLALTRPRTREAGFVLAAAVCGYLLDSLLTTAGLLRFPDARALAPPWIAGLWLAFSTTINVTFRWFRSRPIAAALLGAVSGPMSYLAGAAFGAVQIPSVWQTCAALAVGWGLLLPILFTAAECVQRGGGTAATAPPVTTHAEGALEDRHT